MSEVLQANVFFFITGIAVIVFTFLFSIALYHVIRLLRSVRRIVDRIETESDAIVGDIEHVRQYITEQSFFARFFRAPSPSDVAATPMVRRTERVSKKIEQPKRKTELKIRNEE